MYIPTNNWILHQEVLDVRLSERMLHKGLINTSSESLGEGGLVLHMRRDKRRKVQQKKEEEDKEKGEKPLVRDLSLVSTKTSD